MTVYSGTNLTNTTINRSIKKSKIWIITSSGYFSLFKSVGFIASCNLQTKYVCWFCYRIVSADNSAEMIQRKLLLILLLEYLSVSFLVKTLNQRLIIMIVITNIYISPSVALSLEYFTRYKIFSYHAYEEFM